METAVTLAGLALAYLIGFVIGVRRTAARKYIETDPSEILSAFMRLNVKDPDECGEICNNWFRSHKKTEELERALETLRRQVQIISAELWRALALFGTLLAAAAVALLIPLVGPSIAQGMFAAAAGLSLYCAVLSGQLNALQIEMQRTVDAIQKAQAEETSALERLNANCSPEAVMSCVSLVFSSSARDLTRLTRDLAGR